MVTTDTHQLVAYYNPDRQLTVALRELTQPSWTTQTLPTTVGWDSHNYVVLALDRDGFIHVSGNMHNVALRYFRSQNPLRLDGFDTPGMIGDRETSVTYPAFFKNQAGILHYSYRDGGSGDGATVWNTYDEVTRSWSRLTAAGLFDGLGEVNAYHNYVPFYGPDGRFHIVFMWRETPVANTNFNISLISSENLVDWETYQGTPVAMPVTPEDTTLGLIVDPVPSGQGLINMGFGLGWDSEERPIVSYHKYDQSGQSQIFDTRLEDDVWQVHQVSPWTDGFRWDLDRTGSLSGDVMAEAVSLDQEGQLMQPVYRSGLGEKTWLVDETTLAVIESLDEHPVSAIAELMRPRTTDPANMVVHLKRYGDYYLRWETLPVNQDQDPGPPYPEPTQLMVYRLGIAP